MTDQLDATILSIIGALGAGLIFGFIIGFIAGTIAT